MANHRPKVAAPAIAVAAGGNLVFWAWNSFVPDHPMPVAVAIVIAALIGTVGGPVHRWLERLGA